MPLRGLQLLILLLASACSQPKATKVALAPQGPAAQLTDDEPLVIPKAYVTFDCSLLPSIEDGNDWSIFCKIIGVNAQTARRLVENQCIQVALANNKTATLNAEVPVSDDWDFVVLLDTKTKDQMLLTNDNLVVKLLENDPNAKPTVIKQDLIPAQELIAEPVVVLGNENPSKRQDVLP